MHADRSIIFGWVAIFTIGTPVLAGLAWKYRLSPHAVLRIDAGPTAEARAATAAPPSTPFAGWDHQGVTIEGGVTAPDGSATGAKITEGRGIGARLITANVNINVKQPLDFTISAHYGQGRRLLLFFETGGELEVRCDVDLQTGKASFETDNDVPQSGCGTTAERDGWWRVQMRGAFNPSYVKGQTLVGAAPTLEPFKRAYDPSGEGFILLAAPVVTQAPPTAAPDQATTDAGGSQFSAWKIRGASVHGHAGASPKGPDAATKVVDDSSNGPHVLLANINVDPDKPISTSLDVHAGQDRRLLLFIAGGQLPLIQCDVDLKTGAATVRTSETTRQGACETEPQRNGWWHVVMKGTVAPTQGSEGLFAGMAPTIQPFGRDYQGTGAGYVLLGDIAVTQ